MRNPATHDSRVLREAKTLSRLGYRPLIVAVVSTEEQATHSIVDGVPILRLSPTSPFSWIRSRLNRLRRERAVADTGAEPAGAAAGPGRGPRMVAIRLHRWIRTIDFYRRAFKLVRAVRPAILHCNDYNTMWVGVAARTIGGTAVVYDAHELWPDRNLRPEPRWWLLACESLFLRLAHRTITASPGYAEVMARRYRVSPPQVIRNIPDLRAAAPANDPEAAAEPPEQSDSADELVYVGALTRNRGLEVSIRALARLPKARLRLLGPVGAAYRSELVELTRNEGVSDRVEFAAPVPPGKVVESIRHASAGLALIQPVCLSYRMSLPNKLFEYLAAGVPVLASDLPAIGALVRNHGVGLVARPDDPDDVAAKVSELLRPDRNRELRLAVRQASGEIRWERESSLLAETYLGAVAAAGRPSPA